ncbi:MAG: CxxC-x17-CxxC domain-containing protein [Thermomicrobiales bacterium]
MADRDDRSPTLSASRHRCADCAAPFAVAVAEATYYRDRALPGPARCRSCRSTRRAERNAGIRASLSAAHDSAQPRAQDRGRGRAVPAGRNGPRPAFSTTCAACGAATTLPFEPRPGRPSYCRACFTQHRQSAPPHRPRP